MLLHLGQVAGAIPTFGLQAIKAIVASQMLDWPTLILRPRFMLFELSNTSQIIAA
jgi:hypothetical protein